MIATDRDDVNNDDETLTGFMSLHLDSEMDPGQSRQFNVDGT